LHAVCPTGILRITQDFGQVAEIVPLTTCGAP
jgi:hypothetical protein